MMGGRHKRLNKTTCHRLSAGSESVGLKPLPPVLIPESPNGNFFNAEGLIKVRKHYNIPPLERLNAEEIRHLIHRETCFVLHTPCRNGKIF